MPLAMALLVWLRPWRTGSSPSAPALRAIGAATGVFVAFAASQLAWMASDVHNHQLIPPERAAGEREQWISRSPFLFVNRANVLGPWLAEHHPPGLDLAALDGDRRYLGVVVLALTAAGTVAARRDAQLLRWFGVAGPALFGIYWLSLGPRTLLWGCGANY